MTARFEPKSAGRDRASDILAAIRRAARQEQFLEVVSAEEARARFTRNVDLSPLPGETVGLSAALGRVLACDVTASIDVPPFSTPALCHASTCLGSLIVKPIVPPLAWLAGLPSMGLDTMKRPPLWV